MFASAQGICGMNPGGSALSALAFMQLAAALAAAQKVSGDLSPSDATTTIEGNYLPPPPPNFSGVFPTPALDWIAILQSICA
jgi:hypothetical protein